MKLIILANLTAILIAFVAFGAGHKEGIQEGYSDGYSDGYQERINYEHGK